MRTVFAIVLLCLATAAVVASSQAATDLPGPAADPQVEHGRYLVHQVAMCVQCHSPRDRFGELQQDRLLTGAPIPVQSPYVGPRWAFTAPNIRRAAGYDKEAFLRLLTTGITNQGHPPRAPMPPFRMSRSDAEAVWSYLRSL